MADAQLRTKIVFWVEINGTIKMGMPEQFPAPPYHEKVVCHTAHEAEIWSQRMRDQEAARERMKDDERDEIEERIRGQLRSHMHNLMANARNNMNRDFLRLHMERYAKRPDLTKMKRESYLHAEAFESGH